MELAIIAVTTSETFFLEPGMAGKHIAGAFARIVPLGFFTISAVVYALKNGVQPLAGADFVPTWAGFVAMVPLLIFTGGNSEKYFTAGLALVISTTFISHLPTFPSMLVLRRKLPDTPRPFRAPFAVLTTVLTTGPMAFAVVVLTWPLEPPAAFAGERLQYTLSQVMPLLIVIGVGFLFYALGTPTRARDQQRDFISSSG